MNLYSYAQSLPFLSTEEQANLIRKYQDHGDMAARERVLNTTIRFVYSLAAGYMHGTIQIDDLVSEGMIGLMKSLESFDLEAGVRLETYAKKNINRALAQYVIDNKRIMRLATNHAHIKLFFNFKALRQNNMVGVTESEAQEIAEKLGVTVADVYEMEYRLMCDDESFNMSDDDSEYLSPEDVIEGHDRPTNYIEDEFHDAVMTEVVAAVSTLSDRRQEIFVKRLLLDKKVTLEQIGIEQGCTHQAIEQIQHTAFKIVQEKVLGAMR